MKRPNNNTLCTNKKAFFNFEIVEKLETGVVLKGCEVKSIRNKHISIKESYARIINNELWLVNCHINPYEFSSHENLNPTRDRKLLVSYQELSKLAKKTNEKGFTLIPLSVYLSSKNLVKVKIGVGKSKKQFDKRESLKQKSIQRELDKAQKHYR